MATETLSCKCLNVTFHVSHFGNESDIDTLQKDSYYNEAEISSVFTLPKPLLPDVADCVQTVIPCLMTSHQHREWKLYTCFNCKTATHAVCIHKSSKVLVNVGELLNTAAQQKALSQKPKTFQLFGVLSTPVTGQLPVKGSLKPSFMESVTDLKTRADKFLKNEKERMEERIKDYEITQRALFKEMEDSIYESRDQLENQIWGAFNENNEDNDSAYERSVEEISSFNTLTKEEKKDTRSSSVVDDVFELDPFSHDLDDADLDDDIFSDEEDSHVPNYRSRNHGGDEYGHMAKSVPVAIPNQMRGSVSHQSGSDSEEDTPDPHQMQASMRALAQSVGADGTQIFGDLPRPRFNTYTRRSQHGDY